MTVEGEPKQFEQLLDEFVEHYLAGEAPDPVEYVQRAGEEAQRLHDLIALFLAESDPVSPKESSAQELAARYRPVDPSCELLLEEFISHYAAGEAPDPVEYVQRAGEEAQRLHDLIALFLAESESVPPQAAVAAELADRFRTRHETEPVEESTRQDVSTWRTAWTKALREWDRASHTLRRTLLDALATQGPAMQLSTERARSAGRAVTSPGGSGSCIFQLEHPPGANATVRGDGCLTVTVFAVPKDFVGSRPFVAFPAFDPSDSPQLAWAGRKDSLPDGIVRADETVGKRRELHATVGRFGGQRSGFESLLSDIRVFAQRADEQT